MPLGLWCGSRPGERWESPAQCAACSRSHTHVAALGGQQAHARSCGAPSTFPAPRAPLLCGQDELITKRVGLLPLSTSQAAGCAYARLFYFLS